MTIVNKTNSFADRFTDLDNLDWLNLFWWQGFSFKLPLKMTITPKEVKNDNLASFVEIRGTLCSTL